MIKLKNLMTEFRIRQADLCRTNSGLNQSRLSKIMAGKIPASEREKKLLTGVLYFLGISTKRIKEISGLK